MRLVWNVKLHYKGGAKNPYRVKLEGNPRRRSDVPHTFSEGDGNTPMAALLASMNEMTASDRADLRLLFNPPPMNWER